ncbi:MAG: macro domain-containing protein [Candidatus Paceibacterota bacterium]
MKKLIYETELEVVQGDIVNQPDVEAVVNAANAQLTMGGGVAGAIHQAAGPELEKECQSKAPIEPGEAVITKAYQLPNDYVIHILGPRYGKDKPEAELLAKGYQNALNLTQGNNINSIAFPAVSCGAFGYPIEEATSVALKTTVDEISSIDIDLIRFVLYNQKDLEVYQRQLNRVL